MEKTNVIKLKYLRAGQPSGREYTFYTLEEIEAFKDRAKTIIGKAAQKAEAEESEQKTLLDV